MDEVRNFEFGTQVEQKKSQPADDKLSLKGAFKGRFPPFRCRFRMCVPFLLSALNETEFLKDFLVTAEFKNDTTVIAFPYCNSPYSKYS